MEFLMPPHQLVKIDGKDQKSRNLGKEYSKRTPFPHHVLKSAMNHALRAAKIAFILIFMSQPKQWDRKDIKNKEQGGLHIIKENLRNSTIFRLITSSGHWPYRQIT